MKLPKTLQKYADRIHEFEDDRGTQNGYWIHYKNGWKSYLDPIGAVHSDHEDTIRELVRCARYAEKCDCQECK